SGAEALEYLDRADEVHAILSDQRMPGMTGVEVLQRARQIRPETTRLLATAHADIRAVVGAINEGQIFRYLAKPWEPDDLQVVVRQAVDHHNLIVEKKRLVAELQATNAKLLEANRLKGAFIEVASHELNTPVTVILGMAELWKMEQGPTASPVERNWMERIHASALRLARTVDRMLKLIKNEEFGNPLDLQMIELPALVERTVKEMAPYQELRHQEIRLEIEEGLPHLEADPAKISDILVNLLANAIKFTPDHGTIVIRARTDPDRPDHLRVAIRDQGAGVDSCDQRYLFEPFFTGFDTLHHSSGDYQYLKRGIGLGLCLVKTFVELHGGEVKLESVPGEGSTFWFSLPERQTKRDGVRPLGPASVPLRGFALN
ncbi:MAG: hybrid sensor histidine kinase/response regulator, partial [Planctomycetes bacterium SCN 63-9]